MTNISALCADALEIVPAWVLLSFTAGSPAAVYVLFEATKREVVPSNTPWLLALLVMERRGSCKVPTPLVTTRNGISVSLPVIVSVPGAAAAAPLSVTVLAVPATASAPVIGALPFLGRAASAVARADSELRVIGQTHWKFAANVSVAVPVIETWSVKTPVPPTAQSIDPPGKSCKDLAAVALAIGPKKTHIV